MRTILTVLAAVTVSTSAHAAPCEYAGHVPTYVGCIADQAWSALSLAEDNQLELDGITTPEAWNDPVHLNGWFDYGASYAPSGYYRDASGVVHLRGLPTNGPIQSAIFTLPEGYRPEHRLIFTGLGTGNTAYRVDVMTNGDVFSYMPVSGWISLDGISFRAAP